MVRIMENGTGNGPGTLDVSHDDPLNVFESIDKATSHGTKRLAIEKIYQKKTQLEHILLRPDTYIGSVEPETRTMWVYDTENDRMVSKEVTFVPGLYKIFDEILVNAADNKQRDDKMNCIKVKINREHNEISVWNNGKGIPVVEHRDEKVYVPELIFGTLLTSSNYDDSQRKVTGGRNGFGAKLCNIFSTKFTVETSCKEYGKKFKQTWTNNMTKTSKPTISDCKEDDFTCVTFSPDLHRFGMQSLDDDIISIMSRRAYDVAGTTNGVRVFLNSKRLPVVGFRQYVENFMKSAKKPTPAEEGDEPKLPSIVYEKFSPRWEVALAVSDRGFQQISFVNSIATTKGGRHVEYITDQIVEKVIEHVKKLTKKTAVQVRPFHVKNHMWLFLNCLIENPAFDSQTKENMTLQPRSFGSKCELNDRYMQQVLKSGIVENIMQFVKFKAQAQLDAKCHSTKHSKLKGLPKLEDANQAGTRSSENCTLILTEGDSAKTLVVAGFSVVGRDRYGVFPLRGKVLNVREASHKQIMENAEIANLLKILGLQYKKKYDTPQDLQTLRYGKMMIMTDQDLDGSHIKGLLINFIHHNWPSLLRSNFVEEFITPIVKVSKGKEEKSFYSIPEYDEWKNNTASWSKWKIKYYKGLGTSTAKEAKEYFANLATHRIKFKYRGSEDDKAIDLAFNKKKADERKAWLLNWMETRKSLRAAGQSDEYIYKENMTSLSYSDFINKEFVQFSNYDNERSIPSLVDGLKPGQRKVLFTCLKRNDKREVKVAQLAGSVAEMSAYHHGEVSLMGTIVNLAQNFVGSNNINVLLPIGQFGTRLQGGKDSASPRYIFTMLNPVTRFIFPEHDDAILNYLYDDNQRVEPEYYCPILPMLLVNGAEGIGTGWSTKVPNHDPREIVANLKRMIHDEDPLPMKPAYKNFKGTIVDVGSQRYFTCGEIGLIDDSTIEITELPVGVWTQNYKETVMEPLLYGSDKQPAQILDYKEYHTDTTVKFVVKMTPNTLARFTQEGLHQVFKLQSIINTSTMVLFDAKGCIRRYATTDEILKEFYSVRLKHYEVRKSFLEGMLQAQADRLTNQARFIVEKIDGIIKIENRKKKDIVFQLVERKYDPDPVKRWKESQKREVFEAEQQAVADENGEEEEEETASSVSSDLRAKLSDFDYLLSMAVIRLSEEEKEKLLKEKEMKCQELQSLRNKTPKDLWQEDLDAFLVALDKQETAERKDEQVAKNNSGHDGPKRLGKTNRKNLRAEVMPSPVARRVPPPTVSNEQRGKFEKLKEKKAQKTLKKNQEDKGNEEDEQLDEVEVSCLFDRLVKKNPAAANILKPFGKGTTKGGIEKFLSHKQDQDAGEDNDEERKKATKGSQTSSKPAAAGKKKVGKKRVINVSSSSDEESVESVESQPGSSGPKLELRERKPVVYNVDDDKDEESDNFELDDAEDFVLPSDDDQEDEDDELETVTRKKGRKAAVKKLPKVVTKQWSLTPPEDDDESNAVSTSSGLQSDLTKAPSAREPEEQVLAAARSKEELAMEKTAAAKSGAQKKTTKKSKNLEWTDSDDDDVVLLSASDDDKWERESVSGKKVTKARTKPSSKRSSPASVDDDQAGSVSGGSAAAAKRKPAENRTKRVRGHPSKKAKSPQRADSDNDERHGGEEFVIEPDSADSDPPFVKRPKAKDIMIESDDSVA